VDEACHLLAWDTEFFGFRIARVDGETLTPERVVQIDSWCLQNQIRCLYFLAGADDPQTARLAEGAGWRLVDVRLTFEITQPQPQAAVSTRPVRPDDLPRLIKIARTAYRDTRFYFDSNFPPHLCDALYETWLVRSCEGDADAVLVLDVEGVPAGYLTCHLDRPAGAGRIGLVGVAAAAQGRGIGQALVRAGLAWFAGQAASRVTVVTQGRNVAAQRLYQRTGFLSAATQLWYHKWFV
jgi:dTDP-4-amino-4,6-dideoxy-D-galactose acyltransferase